MLTMAERKALRRVGDSPDQHRPSWTALRCDVAGEVGLRSGWDQRLGRRGLTIYLTLPQRYMDTHFRWLRLMVSAGRR